jgi:hypothetical protein
VLGRSYVVVQQLVMQLPSADGGGGGGEGLNVVAALLGRSGAGRLWAGGRGRSLGLSSPTSRGVARSERRVLRARI